MDAESYALTVDQLTINYEKCPAIWDISLEIPKGMLVGIIGPNGAGKSTLLKGILDLVKPLSGKVSFFGEPLQKVRQRVGYIPQRETVDWDFPITVKDLILMGRYGKMGLFRWPREADYKAAEYYLDVVGLNAFANRQISQLSGGQQQRAFLARALMQEADIYFMDEPFVGIDATTEKELIEVFRKLKEQGKTVFVVHHDLSTVSNYYDWLVVLNMRLIASGPVDETLTAEVLQTAYGKSYDLFGEAFNLIQHKSSGKN